MNARLFNPDNGDEITIRGLANKGEWWHGKVERVSCSGSTMALFNQFEQMVNDNIIVEAERLGAEIDRLGFLAELPSKTHPIRCHDIQLMNGDDLSFQVEAGAPEP